MAEPPEPGRGRPRNEQRPAAPDPRPFGVVVAAIKAVPAAARPAVKELAIRLVDIDAGIPGAAGKVFRRLLEALNWETGHLFVTNDRLAEELDITVRAVEKANQVLQARGYLNRQRRPRTGRGGGHDLWRSTIPAVVPEADLLAAITRTDMRATAAVIRTQIRGSAAVTRTDIRVEPLVVVAEREKSEPSASLYEENTAEAAPWTFHLPTEAQVAQFAQTAAAWKRGPVDQERARQSLQRLLSPHTTQVEAGADVEQALAVTLDSMHELATEGRSRGGGLANYLRKAFAGHLRTVRADRAEHEANLAAIAAKNEAKVAAEVAIGERRVAAFNAKAASNVSGKKAPNHPTGRYAVDKDGRQTFNAFAVIRFGFTEIPGKRLADLLEIFPALLVQDIEDELADLEVLQPIDSKGRRLQLTQNEILAGIYGNLRRTAWHRSFGHPWDRCGGTPYPNTQGDWLAISMEVVGRIAAETELTVVELGAIFSHLSRQIEEGGELCNYWSAETWQAHYEKIFEDLAKQEQAKRAAQAQEAKAAELARIEVEKAHAEQRAREARARCRHGRRWRAKERRRARREGRLRLAKLIERAKDAGRARPGIAAPLAEHAAQDVLTRRSTT